MIMTRIKIILTLLLCSVVSIGFAEGLDDFDNINKNYKYIKKRVIDASFNASSDYTLGLYGKFSDYEISTWNESYIGFHVEIVTKSNKEERAEELLHQIDIDFKDYKANKKIVAKTVLPNKTNNVEFQIDYYIMIPENIFLVMDNSYGNINIDKLNRYFDLNLDYGNFSIDSLFADNKIDVSYGNAKIKYADKADCKVSYGNIRINTGNEVNVNLKYGNGRFGEIESLKASCSFSDVEINNVLKEINLTSAYGDVEIENVDKDFELINLVVKYADVDIALDESHSFSY